MSPSAYPGTISPGTFSSGYSSDGSAYRPDFATPTKNYNTHSEWHRSHKNSSPLDYTDSVKEMDRQLDVIRTKPSKIIVDKKKFVAIIDMSNFKPEDIELNMEQGLLTVKAEHKIQLDSTTYAIKIFTRKFTIPQDVRIEMVATELNLAGMLTITALRNNH